ncbi:hypothetical protein FV139_13040 [Parahaliea maris]|uniref:Solitary outer membrane autotransporter beta-barrel domain-containing protein n=1 Tax=Parahaliea maris TaxID=2716870 RepID=A0A5C8ZYR9_9GAMM|nr:hypothetical protein [Parahaliea maris]TXS92884.1 hypothetical protein FV139_13040 [Parahaliea maris]
MPQSVTHCPHHTAPWALAIAITATLTLPATAQEDSGINFRELGQGYAHMISFAAAPEISASGFRIDSETPNTDNVMAVLKVPLYKEFEIEDSDWRWYAQGAFSSLRYTEELDDLELVPGMDMFTTDIDAEWEAYTGVAEAGLIMPLTQSLSLTGGFGAGGTRLKNDSSISNAFVRDILAPVLEGQVINWRTSAVIGRATVGLAYRDTWYDNLKVRGSTSYVYSYVESFNESEGFPSFQANTGSMSAKFDVAQPLSATINEHPLYLIGHVAGTAFTGPGRDQFGFTHFYEVGVALGYRQVALGLQAVLGPDVDGLTITFDYGF